MEAETKQLRIRVATSETARSRAVSDRERAVSELAGKREDEKKELRASLAREKVRFRIRKCCIRWLGGGHTRQEDVEETPTQGRTSPSIQRILRKQRTKTGKIGCHSEKKLDLLRILSTEG